MSWEGYSQNFCEKGHFFQTEVGFDEEPTHCECGALIALCNVVDDTNCDSVGIIPPDIIKSLLLEEEETAVCNLGHIHVTKWATYRIPSDEELCSIRYWWSIEDEKYRRFVD